MKVLIVDDTAFMRTTLKNTLEQHGFKVIGEAENRQIAIEKYAKLKPDLVTMDITMPVIDGISATKKILENDPFAKIIMVSAMGQKNMVIEALQIGAKDFIIKPFQPSRIIDAISKASKD